MGQFPAGPINKAVPSFTSSLIRVTEDIPSIYLYSKKCSSLLKKVFALTAFEPS